jgi:hypothetical protein
VLFYFDHNVSSQMAQQPEFNLVKGPAYHWDFLLLSVLVSPAVDASPASTCYMCAVLPLLQAYNFALVQAAS